jgi:hypothetical protein
MYFIPFLSVKSNGCAMSASLHADLLQRHRPLSPRQVEREDAFVQLHAGSREAQLGWRCHVAVQPLILGDVAPRMAKTRRLS